MMYVHLKVNRERVIYQLPKDDTIFDLKEMIFDNYQIPIHSQKIMHRTGELSNDIVLCKVKRRKRRKLQLACFGYFNPNSLELDVSDIIEHVIEFLPMRDVISCSQVCIEWKRLANLGSEFNETRYVFVNNSCYDLIFRNINYKLTHDVHNVNDVYYSEFEIFGERPYRGSQYVTCVDDEEKLRVYRTYDGCEVLTKDISKFIPKEFTEKMDQRKVKIYVPDSKDKMKDYEGFGDLIGSHYDKMRRKIYLIFDSFIVVSDLHGKILGTIDVDKEAFGRYTVFAESISFSKDFLLLRRNCNYTNEGLKLMIISKDRLKVEMEVEDNYHRQRVEIPEWQRPPTGERRYFFNDDFGLVMVDHGTIVKFHGDKFEKTISATCIKQIGHRWVYSSNRDVCTNMHTGKTKEFNLNPGMQMIGMVECCGEVGGFYCIDKKTSEYISDRKYDDDVKLLRLAKEIKEYKKVRAKEFGGYFWKVETLIKIAPCWTTVLPKDFGLVEKSLIHRDRLYMISKKKLYCYDRFSGKLMFKRKSDPDRIFVMVGLLFLVEKDETKVINNEGRLLTSIK